MQDLGRDGGARVVAVMAGRLLMALAAADDCCKKRIHCWSGKCRGLQMRGRLDHAAGENALLHSGRSDGGNGCMCPSLSGHCQTASTVHAETGDSRHPAGPPLGSAQRAAAPRPQPPPRAPTAPVCRPRTAPLCLHSHVARLTAPYQAPQSVVGLHPLAMKGYF